MLFSLEGSAERERRLMRGDSARIFRRNRVGNGIEFRREGDFWEEVVYVLNYGGENVGRRRFFRFGRYGLRRE